MRINKVAFIGKGGVGLLYGSMVARALGEDAEWLYARIREIEASW